MSLAVGVSREEAFHMMMDYFQLMKTKVIESRASSSIVAEVGAWGSHRFSNAKGKVTARIIAEEKGSHIELSFNFLATYLMSIVVATIFSSLFYGIIWWLASMQLLELEPIAVGNYISMIAGLSVLVIVLIFVFSIGLSACNASQTKKRFIENFKKSRAISDMIGITKMERPR
jgi:ABC-type amino acid transport system permease subunit